MSTRATFLQQFDRLLPETKSSIGNLTRIKNRGGSDADMERAIAAVAFRMKCEQRLAGNDPVRRILADPVKRTYINAIIRHVHVRKHPSVVLSEEQQEVLKALGTGSSPGNTLLVDEVVEELFSAIAVHGAWNTLGVVPLGAKTARFPVITAPPKAQFVTEGDPFADDTENAGLEVSDEARDLGALLNMSLRWLEDVDMDLTDQFLESLGWSFSARLDHAFLNGSGAVDGDNGGITGVMQNGTVATVVAGAGGTTLQGVDHADLTNLIGAVEASAIQRGPRFWLNPTLLFQLMKVRDGSGKSVVSTVMEEGGDTLFSCMGFPLTLTSGMPSTNVAGSKVLLFGRGRAYGVGLRQELRLETSDHARFNYLQRSYRAIGRAAGKMRRAASFATLTTSAV